MDAGHATYGMMACEARGWQEVEDNMEKMRREKRMGEVLRVHILALRSGGSCTANRTGRKAEQWNNLCCRFGTEFNVNLHVGGNGAVPKNTKSESVTLIAVIEGTRAARGKAGIQTDAYTKMLNDTKAAGAGAQAYGIWDDYMRYDRVLQHIAEGHEPSKLEEELMERWECAKATKQPYVKSEVQVSAFIFHFDIFVCENGFCAGQEGGSSKESSRCSSTKESSSKESSSRCSSSKESSSKESSSKESSSSESSSKESSSRGSSSSESSSSTQSSRGESSSKESSSNERKQQMQLQRKQQMQQPREQQMQQL